MPPSPAVTSNAPDTRRIQTPLKNLISTQRDETVIRSRWFKITSIQSYTMSCEGACRRLAVVGGRRLHICHLSNNKLFESIHRLRVGVILKSIVTSYHSNVRSSLTINDDAMIIIQN